MAEIINLRLARKAATRAKAQTSAAEARAKHGQTKAEKQATAAETTRHTRTVEGAKRTPKSPSP